MAKQLKLYALPYLLYALLILAGCQSAQTNIENRCLKRGYAINTAIFDECVNAETQALQQQMIEQVHQAEPFLPTSPTPGVN